LSLQLDTFLIRLLAVLLFAFLVFGFWALCSGSPIFEPRPKRGPSRVSRFPPLVFGGGGVFTHLHAQTAIDHNSNSAEEHTLAQEKCQQLGSKRDQPFTRLATVGTGHNAIFLMLKK